MSPNLSSPIIEFRNVGFTYGTRTIFDSLCFSVTPGETVALIGPNGVGKTTLLRLATGLLRPSSGEILVQGLELGAWTRRQLSCCVALVPQHLEVPFAFRVEEIVAQGRVPHLGFFGSLTAKDHAAIESAMEAVDIVSMRRRIFSELSGGERQRVKIAIGLAQQPQLMLLDEPTQHLDLGRQLELMALLRRLVERGITIVSAVHDLALVRDNCTSAILLTPNAPAIAGPVTELLRADLLERAFSVERPGLDRYLATHHAPQPAVPQSAAQSAPPSPVKSEPPDHYEQPRPGEQPRHRGVARLSRNWRHWKHD
jgi:iron complex transport system ATP-binding protein